MAEAASQGTAGGGPLQVPGEPPRVHLAPLPTPLHHLPRLSERLGIEVLCKRDDLTGSALSGNKVRKLEYLLADARAVGADTVITCGGAQSNHCRATALAAAQLGLRCRLLLRTDDPAAPPPLEGNLLLDRVAGAEVRFISRPDYARRAALMDEEVARLSAAGSVPYVIPEGGSNAIGAWGYVRAIFELRAQLAAMQWREKAREVTIVYAAGSGGTGAGLVAGAALADLEARIVGFAVCDDAAYFQREIARILAELASRFDLPRLGSLPAAEIVDEFVGVGYAKTRPEELRSLVAIARAEGLVLDPVYTGKAMHGLCELQRRTPGCLGERVIFVHTGGVFGLLTAEHAASLAAIL